MHYDRTRILGRVNEQSAAILVRTSLRARGRRERDQNQRSGNEGNPAHCTTEATHGYSDGSASAIPMSCSRGKHAALIPSFGFRYARNSSKNDREQKRHFDLGQFAPILEKCNLSAMSDRD